MKKLTIIRHKFVGIGVGWEKYRNGYAITISLPLLAVCIMVGDWR